MKVQDEENLSRERVYESLFEDDKGTLFFGRMIHENGSPLKVEFHSWPQKKTQKPESQSFC